VVARLAPALAIRRIVAVQRPTGHANVTCQVSALLLVVLVVAIVVPDAITDDHEVGTQLPDAAAHHSRAQRGGRAPAAGGGTT
jgi:hypothetical protein